MSDSGEVMTTTTFFDTMPVEDFISLIEEFLEQPSDIEIDEDAYVVPTFDETVCDEPTSLEKPWVDPTSLEKPWVDPTSLEKPSVDPTSLDEPCHVEPTSSDADYNYSYDLDAPYSEYEGWGDAEFSFDPTDSSYIEWSSAYEYAHDYAEAVWGDSNSW